MSSDLSDAHELQLQAFLRFINWKRRLHLQEILQCVTECEDSKISPGEMYSSSDVTAVLETLKEDLQKYASKEVENAYHSSALLVKLQLLQAQQSDLTITVDMALLENEQMLQQIKACEAEALKRPAADFAVKRAGMLSGMTNPAVRTVTDSAIVQQRDQLRAEVEALRSRLESLQAAASTAASEKDILANRLAEAHNSLAAKDAQCSEAKGAADAHQAAAASARKELAKAAAEKHADTAWDAQRAAELAAQQVVQLQQQLKAKEAQAKAAEQALLGKLQDSKQWQQMRQLMQAKSQEVVQLRTRLAKYEPQDIPNADAAAAQAAD